MTAAPKSGESAASDAELVRAALADDHDAWANLVRRHSRSLYRVAQSFQLDKAATDDAVQTTWMRLVEHIGALRDPDSVGAWLRTTLRRQITSTFRTRGRGPHLIGLEGADVPDPGRSPEDELMARDRDARMRAAVRRLTARDRELVTLLMASPKPSYRRVSAELRIPVGSIGPTRARCLRRLRHELEEAGIDGTG